MGRNRILDCLAKVKSERGWAGNNKENKKNKADNIAKSNSE